MKTRESTAAPVIEAPESDPMTDLIIETYGRLEMAGWRMASELAAIQQNATTAAQRYAELAEQAVTGITSSALDSSFRSAYAEKADAAVAEYRVQALEQETQKRLLRKLLACTTATVNPAIIETAK